MNNSPTASQKIDLAREGETSTLVVDMESFFAFSFWMAEELSDLVAENELRNSGKFSIPQHRKSMVQPQS